MTSIQSNGYGLNGLFANQSGLGRILGNGYLSTSVQGSKDTTATFAADIVSRITPPTTEDLQDATLEQFGEDSASLAGSLQRTVEYVQDRYGTQAGTAVMGMIYNKIGNGEVTEESLGSGLLDSVKFIDRNFGMTEGDSFMSFLNNDLNEEMNTFFDNGLEERFFAASPGTTSLTQSISTALSTVSDSAGKETADSILSLIEQATQDTESPLEALKQALEEADQLLSDQGQGTFTAMLAQNVAKGAASVVPQTGSLLNVTV